MIDDFDLEKIVLKNYVTFNEDLFIKKFGQKSLNIAIWKNFQDAIRQLIKAQCHFIFLYECYSEIKRVKKLYDLLSKKEKKSLNQITKVVACITFALNEILIAISDGLNIKKK